MSNGPINIDTTRVNVAIGNLKDLKARHELEAYYNTHIADQLSVSSGEPREVILEMNEMVLSIAKQFDELVKNTYVLLENINVSLIELDERWGDSFRRDGSIRGADMGTYFRGGNW